MMVAYLLSMHVIDIIFVFWVSIEQITEAVINEHKNTSSL
jgi:hypothetical protein